MQTITVTVNNSVNTEFFLKLIRKFDFIKSIVTQKTENPDIPSVLTARELLHSGIIGMWENRKDIKNSSSYSRKIRQQAQKRKIRGL